MTRRIALARGALLLCVGFIGYRLLEANKFAVMANDALQDARASVRILNRDRSIMLQQVRMAARDASGDTAFFSGRDARTGSSISLTAVETDIVYIVSTTCGACTVNYPILKRWQRAGVRIVAVSYLDGNDALRRYAAVHSLSFPLVARGYGRLARLTSIETTPVALHFTNGRLLNVYAGRIPESLDSALMSERGLPPN